MVSLLSAALNVLFSVKSLHSTDTFSVNVEYDNTLRFSDGDALFNYCI